MRRVFASGFRAGFALSFRWIPSELNLVDKGSRFLDQDYDPGKSPLHALAQSLIRSSPARTCDQDCFSCEQNTLSNCMYRREHCVHTAHCTDLLRVAQVVPSIKYSFHLLFRAVSHDLHSTRSILSSLSLASTSPSLTSSGPRLITAPIHEALEVRVSRIQNLAQVMSPTGLSTTR